MNRPSVPRRYGRCDGATAQRRLAEWDDTDGSWSELVRLAEDWGISTKTARGFLKKNHHRAVPDGRKETTHRRQRTRCAAEDCDRFADSRQLCQKHRYRQMSDAEREHALEQQRKRYYVNNGKEYARKRRQNPSIAAKERASSRRYRLKNREDISRKARIYYRENRDRLRAQSAAYYARNRDLMRTAQRERASVKDARIRASRTVVGTWAPVEDSAVLFPGKLTDTELAYLMGRTRQAIVIRRMRLKGNR